MFDNNTTPTQWRSIRSRRGKTALAAKALWDVVLGLEPDGPTDRGDYIRFYSMAETALRHFRDGTTASYAERRPKTYKEFEAILSALAALSLETAKSAYMNRSHDHKVERKAKLARLPKTPKPASKSHEGGSQCSLCDDIIGSGKFCSACRKRLDRIATLLAERGPLLVSEVTQALQFDDDECALGDLEADARFVKDKGGRWSLSAPAPMHAASPAGESITEEDAGFNYERDPEDNSPPEPDFEEPDFDDEVAND
jgi:hypothetical protein